MTITCRKSILAWGRGSFSVTLLPRPLFQRDPHDQAREQRRQQAARERLILAALQVIIDVRFRRMNWGRGQISLDLSQPLLELFKGDPTPGEALLSRVEWPPELR